MQTATAAFVAERAERSIHLLEGLQAALIALGHADLARIAAMAQDDANTAQHVLRGHIDSASRQQKEAILEDLKLLTQMAGPPAAEVARQAWRRVTAL